MVLLRTGRPSLLQVALMVLVSRLLVVEASLLVLRECLATPSSGTGRFTSSRMADSPQVSIWILSVVDGFGQNATVSGKSVMLLDILHNIL